MFARHCLLFLLLLFPCRFSFAQIRGQLPAQPSTIHIRVQTDTSQPRAIPQTIFGTFLEPIGNAINGGLWAELLENPSLEPEMWDASHVASMLKERPELERATRLDLPLPWEPLYDWQGNRYEPHRGDAANSDQSILLMGLPAEEVGIRQRIYLPAQRELEYTGSIWVKHVSGGDAIDVSLRERDSPQQILAHAVIRAASTEWARYRFSLKLPAGQLSGPTPVDFVVALNGDVRTMIDQLSLMPADNIEGMDPEVVAKVRDFHQALIRFGGNFTSGYHFENGIGPSDQRLSLLNLAWGIPEYNTFGTGEFLRFCQLVGAQPQIALNLGSGTPQEAARWVQYVNARWGDHSGGLLWELGNELWGDWNMGYPAISQAAERTTQFSGAVRKVDPKAELIATGQDVDIFRDWNAQQLTSRPGTFDYLSTHFVVDTNRVRLPSASPDFVTLASLALPVGIEKGLREMAEQVMDSDHKSVRLAFTEWVFVAPGGSNSSPGYANFGGAIDAAGFLNMLMRVSDIVPVADMTGTVEIAGVLKKRGRVYVTPSAEVFRMYSNERPAWWMPVDNDGPSYSVAHGVSRIPEIEGVPWLEVVAAETADRDKLILFCVNRSLTQDIRAQITLAGFPTTDVARVETLTSPSLDDENSPDNPEKVAPKENTLAATPGLEYTFPHASVVIMKFSRAGAAK